MGKRGKRPTPDAILHARGSDVPKRRESRGAVVPTPVAAMDAPRITATPTYDQAMDIVCRAVDAAGVAIAGGELALDLFARSILDYHTTRERLAAHRAAVPLDSIDSGSAYVEMMLTSAANHAHANLLKLFKEHGLTPASISEIHIPAKAPKQIEAQPVKAPLRRAK